MSRHGSGRHSPRRWSGRLVEAFLIVASILLAFAIDAWWDDRSEGREDRALLEGFREDLRAEAAVQMGGFGRMRDRELSRALIGYYAIPFAATNDAFNEARLAGVYFPYDRALRRALGRGYRALMTCDATDGACIRTASAGLRLGRVAADPEMAEHLVGLSAYAPFWLSVIRTQNEARARVFGRVEAALDVD